MSDLSYLLQNGGMTGAAHEQKFRNRQRLVINHCVNILPEHADYSKCQAAKQYVSSMLSVYQDWKRMEQQFDETTDAIIDANPTGWAFSRKIEEDNN